MFRSLLHYLPNSLSVLRIMIALLLGTFFFLPVPLIVVQVLVVVGLLSDKLDGTIARIIGNESDLGKRLESIADPLFSLACGLVITFHLDFPLVLFLIGVLLLILASIGRAITSMKTKKFFYEKSPVTRYGVGVIYLVILLYIFQLPYREWVAWGALAVGIVVSINYWRMMVVRLRRTMQENA